MFYWILSQPPHENPWTFRMEAFPFYPQVPVPPWVASCASASSESWCLPPPMVHGDSGSKSLHGDWNTWYSVLLIPWGVLSIAYANN